MRIFPTIGAKNCGTTSDTTIIVVTTPYAK